MTPERWQQIDRLLEAALEHEPGRRAAFLDQACGGDAALRREVEALLAADERAGRFLEAPAVEVAAEVMAADPAGLAVGQTVGSYKVPSELGAGGMGRVYLAEDRRLGRRVALKVLAPHLLADGRSRTRFLREARLAAALDHPNICTIHEVGETDGQSFLSMQWVQGRTLKELIGGRPGPMDSVLSIGLQVADALRAAHAQGIIHRDITSNNIMVTAPGQAKVLDFGLAKLLAGEAAAGEAELSRSGALVGTPAYMAPEQARGERADPRSDLFALGVVLYEMATGRPPFRGKSAAETLHAIIHEPHRPAGAVNKEIPPGLSAVIDRAMAKEPAGRYQSAEEMLAALRSVAQAVGLLGAQAPEGGLVPYVPLPRER